MFALKPLSKESVPAALAKAERYRLLNEPEEAESICRDALAADESNREASVQLVLALSDQIATGSQAFPEGLAAARNLESPYDRAYYEGLLWERRAKHRVTEGGVGARHTAYEWIRKAMGLFEEAERQRPAGNDDAVLRWNACVRFLERHPELAPAPEEPVEAVLSE